MIVVWAGTSDLVSEPIGQTTTTALILLVLSISLAYPGMDWDGIERTRSAIGLVFWGWGKKLASSQADPRPVSCPDRQQLGLPISPLLSVEWPNGSSTFPGLRPELYEAETRLTYGSEAEPHPSNNGAA